MCSAMLKVASITSLNCIFVEKFLTEISDQIQKAEMADGQM